MMFSRQREGASPEFFEQKRLVFDLTRGRCNNGGQ